ncbi:phosphoribosyltransferase family protein [Rhodocytophaga aerolata]|uniref:Phosphoribosyltransferase family protein n=1 Tax=Rhodocytophaga aerolata TaxID=455078 RepID=A0ABT8RDC2_9BACT|nr:phosphoribosyltransferase family protein [Rhodocytophaga aerolata]MDO1450089.1 phosphoribosyltransferase family protein [Rhodocytophaga aerolata]
MTATSTLILTQKQTLQKIKRIAYEVYENNFQEDEIILAGIYDKGYLFAKLLQQELKAISPIKVTLVKVSLDKLAPLQSDIFLDCDTSLLRNKVVILLDDVLNTGRTLVYSLKPFLNVEIKKLSTAVIVDRNHKQFPISADYIGYALSTTIQEHIEVVLEDEERFGVYLS